MKWFDLIKRVVFVFAICLFSIAAMSLFTQKIPSPGLTGMMSNSGVQEIRITDARYLENVDNHETAGVLKKRNSLVALNSTDRRIDGAYGYYEPIYNTKNIVGIVPLLATDSIFLNSVGTYIDDASTDTVTFADSSYYLFPGGYANTNGILRVSDTFTSVVTNADTGSAIPNDLGTIKRKFAKFGAYHDFTSYGKYLIHCDGLGLPTVFVATEYDDAVSPDTQKYEPRFLPLSLPKPGQLSVRIIDTTATTTLNGIFEYMYTIQMRGIFPPPNITDTSFHSIIVSPKDQVVLIDGFLGVTYVYPADTTRWDKDFRGTDILLFRRQIKDLEGDITDSAASIGQASNWDLISHFWMSLDEAISVIDSGQVTGSTLADFKILGPDQDESRPPGVMGSNGRADTAIATAFQDDVHYAIDSTAWVAWSWYDPVTGLESGLSMLSKQRLLVNDSSGTTWPTAWSLPYLSRQQCPTNFVRIYRTVTKDDMTGAGDSAVFYGIIQMPVDLALNKWQGSVVIMGVVSDSALDVGPPSFSTLGQTYGAIGQSDTFLIGVAPTPYTFENEVFDSLDGGVLMRPPFIAPLVIPFTDMEFSNSRLWGIGDPLYPQRLYYSGLQDWNAWNPIQYLSLDEGENDKIVAIEKIEGPSGDAMYGLKRNSIYLVSGYDPEYDLSIFRLSDKIGADSRFTVIKDGVTIYFMTPNQRIYSLFNNQLEWISYPIQDYCDTAFAHTDSVRTFILEDKVVFAFPYGVSDKNNYASYHPLSKSWSIDTYSDSLEPYGSIQYDTLQNTVGFNGESWWVFERDSLGAYFYYEGSDVFDSFPLSVPNNPYRYKPLVYQTPEIGDGENLFQMMSCQVTLSGENGQVAIASVRNRIGTELVADTIAVNANSYQDYTFTFSSHASKYLSIRISGDYTTEIDDVIIKYRRVGRGKIY